MDTAKIKAWLSNKYNLVFLAILIVALIIRLKYFFAESIWNDETFYLWYVENSLAHPSYWFSQTMFGNAYYFFAIPIAVFKLLLGDIVWAGRLASLLFNMAGIILVYLIGAELKNKLTGLIAAIFISIQHLYWFIGHKVLLDAPLATSFLFVALCLIKWEKSKSKLWAFMLAFSMLAVIETKQSGILVLPILAIYGLLQYIVIPLLSRNYWENIKGSLRLLKKKSTYLPIILFLLIMMPYFIGSQVHFETFVSSPSASPEGASGAIPTAVTLAKTSREIGAPYSASLTTLRTFIFTPYINIFLLLGFIYILLYRRKIDSIILSFVSYYVLYTILTGGIVEPRYALPAIPFFALIAGFGLEETGYYLKLAIKKIKKIPYSHINTAYPSAIILITLVLAVPIYERGAEMFAVKNIGYTGYKEAGAWINENVPPDAVLFAGSPGYIRLFSKYNFINGTRVDEGFPDGNIYYGFKPSAEIENPTPEMFAEYIQTLNKDIYMEVDVWEYANQEWMYPLSQEKFEFLFSLGFKPIHIIEKEVLTIEGPKIHPVIFILKRDKPA